MRHSLALVLAVVCGGCLSSQFVPAPSSMDGGSNPGPGPGPGPGGGGNDLGSSNNGGGVSGTIASDTSWTGAVSVSGDVMIAPGATLTVAAGTTVSFATTTNLIVSGKLVVSGTSASPVTFTPSDAQSVWQGVTVAGGGSIDLAYLTIEKVQTPLACLQGAAQCKADHTTLQDYTGVAAQIDSSATLTYMTVQNGGSDGITIGAGDTDTVTITDSTFHATGGDATVSQSGNLTFQYNAVYGSQTGGGIGLHCACHYDGTGTYLVDHNDFYDAVYGLMASKMSATSKVNYNNFYQNGNEWGSADGTGVNPAADITNDYWGGGAPPTITGNPLTTPYSMTKISGTGPR